MTNKEELINKLDPNKVKCMYCERYINKDKALFWGGTYDNWCCDNFIECDLVCDEKEVLGVKSG